MPTFLERVAQRHLVQYQRSMRSGALPGGRIHAAAPAAQPPLPARWLRCRGWGPLAALSLFGAAALQARCKASPPLIRIFLTAHAAARCLFLFLLAAAACCCPAAPAPPAAAPAPPAPWPAPAAATTSARVASMASASPLLLRLLYHWLKLQLLEGGPKSRVVPAGTHHFRH